jgi:hypothetical protein
LISQPRMEFVDQSVLTDFSRSQTLFGNEDVIRFAA